MSEKVLTIRDLRKLCGGKRKSALNIIEYLSSKEEPVTEPEIKEGINYRKKSNYTNKLLNDLRDLGLIDRSKAPKKLYKYKLSVKNLVINF